MDVDGIISLKDNNSVTGNIVINTGYMYEQADHLLMVVARKDTRFAFAYQSLFLTKGEPPRSRIV